MTMKTTTAGVAALLAAAVGLPGFACTPGDTAANSSALAEDTRPNVVMIMVDDARYDDMAALPQTRALLGGTNGATYTNAYVSTPLCCPSRATLLTGQYSHNHGVWDNFGPNGGGDALADSNTLPVWLQRGGYQTSMIGKYLNGLGQEGEIDDPTYIPPGWSRWAALTHGTTAAYVEEDLSVGESTPDAPGTGTMVHRDNYQTRELTARAVSRIGTWAPDGPMFMWLSYFAPHGDSTLHGPAIPVPPEYDGISKAGLPSSKAFDEADVADKPGWVRKLPRLTQAQKDSIVFQRRERRDALAVVDDGVADVVAALKASGEYDNTVVMFMSDNGVMQGEHRIAGGKRWPYRESARVPLLIRGPGFTSGTHTEPVSNVDLAPTIADLANVTPGLAVDGMSLLNQPPADRPILLEYLGHEVDGMPTYSSVIQNGKQYTEYTGGGRELYDLASDPWQQVNRANNPAMAAVRQRLSGVLAGLR